VLPNIYGKEACQVSLADNKVTYEEVRARAGQQIIENVYSEKEDYACLVM